MDFDESPTGEQLDVTNDDPLTDAERLTLMEHDIAEIHRILAPLADVIATLPDAMEKLGPIIEAVKQSPVLRMIGVKL